MATESPIRISEAGGKWPSHKEAATFGQPSRNMVTEDLGILLKGHRFHGRGNDVAPNRSGSAPPSMEGSFLAIENLLHQQNTTENTSLTTLSRAVQNCESEEQLRASPAYLAYYSSNVNLNPRLPPPLTSWENRHLGHHIGSFRDNGRFSSDHGSKSSLSTHKEEPEDDSPKRPYENELVKTTGVWHRPGAPSLASQHKNAVDLIQVTIFISTSQFCDIHSIFLHINCIANYLIISYVLIAYLSIYQKNSPFIFSSLYLFFAFLVDSNSMIVLYCTLLSTCHLLPAVKICNV